MKSDQPQPDSTPFASIAEVEKAAETRMDKVIVVMQHDMGSVRTGRASIHLLDGVNVEAYGSPTPLNHVATLHVPDPALITLQPYDSSQINAIEKAIRSAGLGLNPSNDGKLIRVPVPALTEERRREMVKHLHHMAEDQRIAVRNVRRDSNEALKKMLKDNLISEDDDRRSHDSIQKLTDSYIAKVDHAVKAKEKEVMEI